LGVISKFWAKSFSVGRNFLLLKIAQIFGLYFFKQSPNIYLSKAQILTAFDKDIHIIFHQMTLAKGFSLLGRNFGVIFGQHWAIFLS
jgi:hypothetical protein